MDTDAKTLIIDTAVKTFITWLLILVLQVYLSTHLLVM